MSGISSIELYAAIRWDASCEGDVEVAALGGESVLMAGWSLAVGDALEHALADESVQPVGEDVAGDPRALLELVEAMKSSWPPPGHR